MIKASSVMWTQLVLGIFFCSLQNLKMDETINIATINLNVKNQTLIFILYNHKNVIFLLSYDKDFFSTENRYYSYWKKGYKHLDEFFFRFVLKLIFA